MSRFVGEAKLDPRNGLWKIVVWIEGGDVILDSESVFQSQHEAEEFLIKALRGLAELGQDQDDGQDPAPTIKRPHP